jgi:hypothetical protein
MPYTLLTFDYALFQAQCPAFANPVTYPEALMQMYWDIAINYITNVANWGALQGTTRQYAINLMVAHLAFLAGIIASGAGNTQVPGMMQTATIDKVTVGLTPPPLPNQFQWWLGLTPYGQMLLSLLQVNSVGGFYIGGSPVRAEMGYPGYGNWFGCGGGGWWR